MTVFYLMATTLTAAVLLLILRPWWRFTPPPSETTRDTALAVAVHRARLAELEQDLHTGALTADDFAAAKTDLHRELLEDAREERHWTSTAGRGNAILIAVFLPLLAGGLYGVLGSPSAMLPDRERAQFLAQDLSQLAGRLAEKLARNPQDAQGWAMLARSYKELERWGEAEHAFERTGQLLDTDATLNAEYAELLMLRDGRFGDRARDLLKKSLALDPNNGLALFLGGTDAFEQGSLSRAETLWSRLLPQLNPESEDAKMIEAGLTRIRKLNSSTSSRQGAAASR